MFDKDARVGTSLISTRCVRHCLPSLFGLMQLAVSQQRAALPAYLSKITSQCLHVTDPAKTCVKCPPNKRFVLVSKGTLS